MLELLSSKVLHLLKILRTRAGREYGISEKIAQDTFGLQSNAFALPCSMALSSAQDRLGFLLLPSWKMGRVRLSVTYTTASNYKRWWNLGVGLILHCDLYSGKYLLPYKSAAALWTVIHSCLAIHRVPSFQFENPDKKGNSPYHHQFAWMKENVFRKLIQLLTFIATFSLQLS